MLKLKYLKKQNHVKLGIIESGTVHVEQGLGPTWSWKFVSKRDLHSLWG